MKLLILTQKVDLNDNVLGYFNVWLKYFAQYYEKVIVVCLCRGEFDLPSNVKVLSLGKETGQSRLKYVFRFYRYIWQERKNYDKVFVHMNPVYIVLAGWWWRLTGKSLALWYTHRQVDLKLRIAIWFANIVFTAARESFGLNSDKVEVVGHGIDVDSFSCGVKKTNSVFTILHIGRLTPIKNCDVLIEAADKLRSQLARPFKVIFIGQAITASDRDYEERLREQVKSSGLEEVVIFAGPVPNRLIQNYYCRADLTINLTPTGGIDKVVLESMAAGVPVLTSNQAFADYFGPYALMLFFTERDSKDLIKKIKQLIESDMNTIGVYLQQVARKRADIKVLIEKIISLWQ